MHDSSQRREFKTGAVRDRGGGKPRPALISPFFDLRLGKWLAKGAEKYDDRNWEKGIPISECIESHDRHIVDYKLGLVDEDHLIAAACNLMFIVHYEAMCLEGLLPVNLLDLPFYLKEKRKLECQKQELKKKLKDECTANWPLGIPPLPEK